MGDGRHLISPVFLPGSILLRRKMLCSSWRKMLRSSLEEDAATARPGRNDDDQPACCSFIWTPNSFFSPQPWLKASSTCIFSAVGAQFICFICNHGSTQSNVSKNRFFQALWRDSAKAFHHAYSSFSKVTRADFRFGTVDSVKSYEVSSCQIKRGTVGVET